MFHIMFERDQFDRKLYLVIFCKRDL